MYNHNEMKRINWNIAGHHQARHGKEYVERYVSLDLLTVLLMTPTRCRQRSSCQGQQFEPITFDTEKPPEEAFVSFGSSVDDIDEVSTLY